MEIHEEVEDEVNSWMEAEPRNEGCRQIESVVDNIVYPVGLPTQIDLPIVGERREIQGYPQKKHHLLVKQMRVKLRNSS